MDYVMLKRNIIIRIVSAALLLLFVHCNMDLNPFNHDNVRRGTGDSQEYFIYSAIFNTFKDLSNPVFVLADSTVFYDVSENVESIKGHFPDLDVETIDSYLTANQIRGALLNIPDLEVVCHLIDYEDTYRWKEQYPNADALIKFSQVGFNADHDQALVYFSYQCGPLCGTGNLCFLRKQDGVWTTIKSLMLWIS